MNIDDAMRIAALRERLYRCIEDELKIDGHHKSYEGALDVTLSFPNIFDRSEQPKWSITWHCYVVHEDGRHHTWSGRSLAEAIAVTEAAVDKICFAYEMNRFGRDMGLCDDEPSEADGSSEIHGPSRRPKCAHPHPGLSMSAQSGSPTYNWQCSTCGESGVGTFLLPDEPRIVDQSDFEGIERV